MAVVGNRWFNDPAIGQGVANIAQMFAPPASGDVANYALAAERKQKVEQLAQLFAEAGNFDERNIAHGNYAYTQSKYAQDQNTETDLAKNAADNVRAIAERQMQEQGLLARQFAEPVLVNENQTAFLPAQTAAATSLPSMFAGNISADPGEQITTPDGRTIIGAEKPLSMTELEAMILAAQPEADQRNKVLGDIPVETIIGADGKDQFVYRPDSVGQRPAVKGPSTVVNMGPTGIDYGDPEKGLAWARNPDGTVKLDERGAPVALPYQGGSVFTEQEAAAGKAETTQAQRAVYADIVTEDVDRAIEQITERPYATTGLGAQVTRGLGGSPAFDTARILDTIKANIGFDRLQEMRNNSPTGGALGPVSDFENQLLQSTIGSLEQPQKPEQLVYNLKRVKEIYSRIINEGIGPEDPLAREILSGAETQDGEPPVPQSQEEFDALPSGSTYRDPDDGKLYRKP